MRTNAARGGCQGLGIVLVLCVLGPARGVAQGGGGAHANPAPHTPEGRPDLTGVWLAKNDPKPDQPALMPAAAAALQKRQETHCLPSGPLIGSGLYKFVQTPSVLVIIFKDVIGYRQIFLDGRPHPKEADPSWMGHSIGHWEGDTLVVDTVAINDRSPLEIYPHTEKVHLTERYRRRDFGRTCPGSDPRVVRKI
jgi:hypothetical protein